ncbi:thioredoxin domain-containing protein [Pseudactinotalea sp. HY160]|uniref:DsbA family protein n=1 Tax=Pseudactinotalea sp. HY160 TaxID=2654490 RepID=UPI00128CAD6D|nr:DsbA family protein [Pseudactinotalea sp. HY160]MPV50867.1 thioredoxin domain-containing protein [Pseudactinotalea sp. HY160]
MAAAQAGRRNALIPILIVVVAIALIAVVLATRGGSTPTTEPAATPTAPSGVVDSAEQPTPPATVNVERRDPADPLAIGELDAPVGIVMYSDFQCGFCALWTDQTLPAILPYVEAGEVRIEWRDIALFGPESHRGALAAYAAGLQGAYLPFHEALFDGGDPPSPDQLSEDGLADVAAAVGLDLDTFRADLASADVQAGVQANLDEAAQLGVMSTPAFLINGHPVSGAQPTPVFTEMIDAELAG